jgi:tetratricopeptide (TPR) repeat protein
MRTRLAGLTLALAVAASPSIAAAQSAAAPYPPCSRTPTDGEVAAAKGAFQAGQASFNEADYDRAVTYWEDAYRRDCTAHPLLLNLARVYELNNQREKAVVALETYVERNPGSADEAQMRRRVEKLREQIAADAPEREAEPEPAVAPPPEPTPEPPPPETTTMKRPIWPLVVAGGGAILLGVGAAFYITATSDLNDFEAQCPNRQCDAALTPAELAMLSPADAERERALRAAEAAQLVEDGNAARSRQTVGVILGVSGLAIGAAGVVYYFVGPKVPSESARTGVRGLTPWAGPGTGGLLVSGGF